jgi:predicted acylesterase/phospholipase RssA
MNEASQVLPATQLHVSVGLPPCRCCEDAMRYRRHRALPAIIVVALLASLLPDKASSQNAQLAQGVWSRKARGDLSAVPVVLTIEGGGSLGVYEAGMTWALTQIFKQQSRPDESRRDNRLPRLRLAGVSGASAGSINALLAATSWCMSDAGQAPEETIFWKAWVTTGVPQLLPPARSDGFKEGGLFSRQYFDSVLFKDIAQSWDKAHWDPDCRVPVGATATRLVPEQLSLLPGVTAKNQRFASTFDVVVASVNGRSQLQFQKRQDFRNAYMGSLASLPAYSDGRIGRDTVFGIFEASSGYPLAFSPKLVRYNDGSTSNRADSAQFSDGGVFDNGPLGLGLGVYFGGHDWPFRVAASRAAADSFPLLLYLSPDNRRRWSDSLSDEDRSVSGAAPLVNAKARGLEAVFQLVGGSVPSARQYELQQAIRLIQDLSEAETKSGTGAYVKPIQYTFASARWHPIVGDWMFGFAGFLGRPLREYDFYVGIYDALELLAEKVSAPILCPEEVRTASPAMKECVARALSSLLMNPPIPLGPVAPSVLDYLFRREFYENDRLLADAAVRQQSTDPVDLTVGVNLAIARGMSALMLSPNQHDQAVRLRTCEDHGFVADLICGPGLSSVLDTIRADQRAMATLAQWRQTGNESCALDAELDGGSHCRADAFFIGLVNDPTSQMHGLLRLLIERLLVTTPMGGVSDKAVRAVGIMYLSLDQPYRRGLDLGQTSIPPRRATSNFVYALPSYVTSSLGLSAAEIGWELRWNPFAATGLVVPLRIGWGRYGSDNGYFARHTRTIQGLAASWKPGFWISEVRAGENVWLGADSISRHRRFADHLSPEISVLAFGSKLRTAIALRPNTLSRDHPAHLIGELGIGDLNGLLFWAFRGALDRSH